MLTLQNGFAGSGEPEARLHVPLPETPQVSEFESTWGLLSLVLGSWSFMSEGSLFFWTIVCTDGKDDYVMGILLVLLDQVSILSTSICIPPKEKNIYPRGVLIVSLFSDFYLVWTNENYWKKTVGWVKTKFLSFLDSRLIKNISLMKSHYLLTDGFYLKLDCSWVLLMCQTSWPSKTKDST